MNFKEWLLKEVFELPFETLREIYNYYLDGYKQYLKAPRTKITPKTFYLDLSGTNYDFLQYLNPAITVVLVGSLPNNSAGVYQGAAGRIYLCFTAFEQINIDTIEHEVLHYLQDLIKVHIKSKKTDRKKRPIIGGVPNPEIIKRILGLNSRRKDRPTIKDSDINGVVKVRRTKHEYRPIEFYTNLNSLIRRLQYNYLLYCTGEDLADCIGDTKEKKKFFDKALTEKDDNLSDLEKVKKLDDDLYKIYIREIYKKFINNKDFGSNASEIKKIIDDGNKFRTQLNAEKLLKKQKQDEKRKEKIGDLVSIKIGNWTAAQLKGRLEIGRNHHTQPEDFSNIDTDNHDAVGYTNTEIAEAMFQAIGLKINLDDDAAWSEHDNFKIGLGYKNLLKIFNNIKNKKEYYSNSNNTFLELPGNVIACNFDYMAHELAKKISNYLMYYKGVEINYLEILKHFYPGPYLDCPKDEYGRIAINEL